MTYSIWQRFITDGGEAVVAGATISVYLESSGAPATLYDGPSGSPIGSTTTSGIDGLAKFFAPAGTYKIVAAKGAFSTEFRFVQLGTAASRDAGVAEGVATLGVDGRLAQNINAAGIVGTIDAGNLPSYVDDVLEYANVAALPGTGEAGKIYIAQDTGASYRWTGTVYIKLSDDDVLEFANLAAFPVSGAGAALYIAADTGLLYRWTGAAYASIGGLSPIADKTILGNVSGGTAAPVALTVAEGQGLLGVNFVTQTRTVSAPNAIVPAHRLYASAAETTVDLVLSPKGNGALLAAMPDNTTTGGNKRGQYAVDWQRLRNASAQVSSGHYSVVSGGWQNKASGASSVVAGGFNNTASGDNSISLGGANNTASGSYASVLGSGNTASGILSVCIGEGNTAANNYAVANGRANGSFGQYTAILSGYTNQASGLYAVVAGGYDNTANGQAGAVVCGEYNFAAGNFSFVGAGQSNTANGICSAVLGGAGNLAAADYSVALGYGANTQTRKRTIVESAGAITTSGDVQVCRSVLRGQTTNATPLRLAVDGEAISAGNTFSSMTYQLLHIKGRCIARAPGTLGDYAIWEFTALMNQNNGTASVTLLAAVSPTLISSGGTGNTWVLAVTADTTYGSLNVTATGEAAKTITWGCALDVLEVRDIA